MENNPPPQVNASTQKWLEWVLITSIPLRRLNPSNLPIEFASACLVDYRNRRFLLTVRHSVGMGSKDWIVDLGYENGKGTEFYRPNSFNYISEMTRSSGSIRGIDFCYTEVPSDLTSKYQHMTPRGIFDERIRHVFQTDLSTMPDSNQIFAFSGQVKPEQHSAQTFATEMNVYPGLQYLRTENEFHVFKLPAKHPGHKQFKGCSGAPIVDRDQNVVALVCDGDESTNTIRGISLARYKFAFDCICNLQNDT